MLEFYHSVAFMQHTTNSEQELRCSEHQCVLKTDKSSMEVLTAYGKKSIKFFIVKISTENFASIFCELSFIGLCRLNTVRFQIIMSIKLNLT